VAIVASGPSLRDDDCGRLAAARIERGLRVIAINSAIRDAPFADVCYAADPGWWSRVGAHAVPPGTLRVSCQASEVPGVRSFHYRPGHDFETDPAWVATGRGPDASGVVRGGFSGYQAINLAVHFGARRVLLLGYDCMPGEHDEIHNFGSHPHGLNNPKPRDLAAWAHSFRRMAPALDRLGVEVVNCSRRTAITAFPRAPLEEVLAWP
jgi:hypothetical protein